MLFETPCNCTLAGIASLPIVMSLPQMQQSTTWTPKRGYFQEKLNLFFCLDLFLFFSTIDRFRFDRLNVRVPFTDRLRANGEPIYRLVPPVLPCMEHNIHCVTDDSVPRSFIGFCPIMPCSVVQSLAAVHRQ